MSLTGDNKWFLLKYLLKSTNFSFPPILFYRYKKNISNGDVFENIFKEGQVSYNFSHMWNE